MNKECESCPYSVSNLDKRMVLLVAEGQTKKEIADTLHLSEASIKRHLEKLMERFGCANRTNLVYEFTGRGIITYGVSAENESD